MVSGGTHSYLATVLLLCTLHCIQEVRPDAFASTTELRQLLASENEIIAGVEEYILSEEKRLAELKVLIAEKKKNRISPSVRDLNEFISHPVNSYNLVKHWSTVTAKVDDKSSINNLRQKFADSRTAFLAEEDLIGARMAMLRLQRTYNLSTENLAQGRVFDRVALPLNYDDYFQLGRTAELSGDYGLAAEWLQLAATAPSDAIYKPDVLLELAQTNWFVGDFEEAARLATQIQELQEDPNNETTSHRLRTYKERNTTFYLEAGNSKPVPYNTASTWRRTLPFWKSNYETLCRGDMDQSVFSQRPDVECIIRNPGNYYSWAKEEILSNDPRISIIHDVITDNEAEKMKEMAVPQLFRAMVGDPAKAYSSEERVSKLAWLWDQVSTDGFIPGLSKRVELITGLTTQYREVLSSSEPFQVVNYGMGGQYEPHVDFYESAQALSQVPGFLQHTGDRVVTFMLYLSDVEAGGSTVFPQINITVPPIKGAAAFWFNIRRSGELDQRTQHAGCPVLLGEKWVANKWIREYGQTFRRPCGLHYNSLEEDHY